MVNSPPLITLFISDLLRGYGSENATLQLVNGLVKKGCSVDLIVQVAGGSASQTLDPRVRQLAIGTRSPLAAIAFLIPYLKKNRPRAFFTVMEKPSLIGVVASFFARYKNIVPTLHFEIDSYTKVDHRARRNVLRLMLAVFYRYAHFAVAASVAAAVSLQRWVGRKTRVIAIYNGFDLAALRRLAAEPVAFPWLADKTAPVFIACGRLVPQKGFDVLLSAFAQLRATESARLIILGEGDQRENLQALAGRLGIEKDVALPGFVANSLAWFAHSDVFVLSSHTEGFGIVLVEALVAGVEIVSTNCPGGPAEILQNGTYGQLVPVNDAPALAAAMKTALSRRLNPAPQSEIQAYLDDHYSLDGMVQAYFELTEKLPA